jgi:hypothetical protein
MVRASSSSACGNGSKGESAETSRPAGDGISMIGMPVVPDREPRVDDPRAELTCPAD